MTGPVAFLNVGYMELVVLSVVALLVFGEKLPDTLRTLGRTYAKLRRSLQEATRPMRESSRRSSSTTTKEGLRTPG